MTYRTSLYDVEKPYYFSVPSFLSGVLVGAGAVIGIAALAGASCYKPKNLENKL